jgi:hypothetical protein
MFEEYIAQGRDMVRRLEAEMGLSETEVNQLPGSERVRMMEFDTWDKAARERVEANCGSDALARYRLASELQTEEIQQREGTERSRFVTRIRRSLAYLAELDSRNR